MARQSKEPRRILGMWLCLATFTARVLGQVEVGLLHPSFLPPFNAWDSGLIPYPLLLPIQILLIAWMAVIASQHSHGDGFFWVRDQRRRRTLRTFSLVYDCAMLVRLIVTLAIPPHTILHRGVIPIVAHWNLAAFIALSSMTPEDAPARPSSV